MTKPESANYSKPAGIVFAIAGVVIFILSLLNYFQDGKISITLALGIFFVVFGLPWLAYGKKHKSPDK